MNILFTKIQWLFPHTQVRPGIKFCQCFSQLKWKTNVQNFHRCFQKSAQYSTSLIWDFQQCAFGMNHTMLFKQEQEHRLYNILKIYHTSQSVCILTQRKHNNSNKEMQSKMNFLPLGVENINVWKGNHLVSQLCKP